MSAPPSALRTGVRAAIVEGVSVGELRLAGGRWAFPATIEIKDTGGSSMLAPARSEWFVVVDSDYPFGTIGVYPSKSSGIIHTFEHQELNLQGPGTLPWRTGKLCLDTPVRRLGLTASGDDPVGNREDRLRWHLTRAVEWIKAARAGSLVVDGDPFELPYCPASGAIRVVHDESSVAYASWAGSNLDRWGQVVWDALGGVDKTVVAVAFTACDGRQLVRATPRYDEARHGPGRDDRWLGIWWLWPSPIVLEPWQVPLSWGDLRSAGNAIGVDVDAHLRAIARSVRGREANILLLGYPIPLRRGEPTSEVHWQAISVPKLEKGGKPPKGFRPNEQGWWQRDRANAFVGKQMLTYLPTVSWHPERMQARGRFASGLRERRVAIAGCGALGSLLAELLVRGGVEDMLLIDHDTLAAGNLVRHTLSGGEIGKNKAAALATRLSSVAPFASVRSHEGRLPASRSDLEQLLEDREIVLDCTGADEVLMALCQGWWSLPKLFMSASVGYEARRVFAFGHRGCSFPYAEFREAVDPLLAFERGRWSERGETLEGAGCWSPLFPARMDDMMLAAAACAKVLEELANEETVSARLSVFEQSDTSTFTGFRRVDLVDGGAR